MDATVSHFLLLLGWLGLALGLFGIGRLAIWSLEKTIVLDKWFIPSSQTYLSSATVPFDGGSAPFDGSASFDDYVDRWHKEEVDELGRANSFLGSMFLIISLFYIDDLEHRFPLKSKESYISLGTMIVASAAFSFGWASTWFQTQWNDKRWFRNLLQSLYLSLVLFGYIYLTIVAGHDWPLFLIGLTLYLVVLLVCYLCFVRNHAQRFGWDFWSMSYLLCLVNVQHDLLANLFYAVFFAHFMATVARYQPPRLFYAMYSSSLP